MAIKSLFLVLLTVSEKGIADRYPVLVLDRFNI